MSTKRRHINDVSRDLTNPSEDSCDTDDIRSPTSPEDTNEDNVVDDVFTVSSEHQHTNKNQTGLPAPPNFDQDDDEMMYSQPQHSQSNEDLSNARVPVESHCRDVEPQSISPQSDINFAPPQNETQIRDDETKEEISVGDHESCTNSACDPELAYGSDSDLHLPSSPYSFTGNPEDDIGGNPSPDSPPPDLQSFIVPEDSDWDGEPSPLSTNESIDEIEQSEPGVCELQRELAAADEAFEAAELAEAGAAESEGYTPSASRLSTAAEKDISASASGQNPNAESQVSLWALSQLIAGGEGNSCVAGEKDNDSNDEDAPKAAAEGTDHRTDTASRARGLTKPHVSFPAGVDSDTALPKVSPGEPEGTDHETDARSGEVRVQQVSFASDVSTNRSSHHVSFASDASANQSRRVAFDESTTNSSSSRRSQTQLPGAYPTRGRAQGAFPAWGRIVRTISRRFDSVRPSASSSLSSASTGRPISAFAVVEPEREDRTRSQQIRNYMIERAPVVEGVAEDSPWSQRMLRKVRNHKRIGVVALLVVVFVGLLGLLVAFIATDSFSSDGTAAPQLAASPSLAPTETPLVGLPPPSASPTSARFALLQSALSSVTNNKTLKDTASPQYGALQWLADEDNFNVSVFDLENITQRFALATLYFATGGQDWTNRSNFLSEEHVCLWSTSGLGVFCSEGSDAVDTISMPANNMTGTLPEEIGLLSTLVGLELHKNALTGNIPATISNLSSLRVLNLNENHLNGTIPTSIGGLATLNNLSFAFNQLSGPVPSSLGTLYNIQKLWIGHNALTGTIPSSLNNLTQLIDLFLSRNTLHGTLPLLPGGLLRLESLQIADNNLTGPLPKEFFALTKLEKIDLENNRLSGTLAPDIGALTNLIDLRLGNNSFIGTVPSAIGNLTNLIFLDLASNTFNGTLLPEFANLTQLTNLVLHTNSFHGPIPETLRNMVSLRHFIVHGNLLTGRVPQVFDELTNLNLLALQNNSLSGSLDFLCGNSTIVADCYGANQSEIICNCCNVCCNDYVLNEGPDAVEGCFPSK